MSDFLKATEKWIKEKGYPIYTIAEIYDGSEAECVTITPANVCQNSYSVAKVFTVTAIGLLFDRGLLSPDNLIVDLLGKEITQETANTMHFSWKSVTVDMTLRHMLSLPNGFLDIDTGNAREFGMDYLSYMLEYPLSAEHGTERHYTDGAYYLLARVAEKLTGMPLDQFLWETIFFPLGFSEVAWSKCPMGHCIGATGLYIRTEDMVKIGEVYRSGGLYQGKRILSEQWVALTLTRGYELRPSGFSNGYAKGGMLGQMLAIFPKQKRVVAWHGYRFTEKNELMRFISQYNTTPDHPTESHT